MKSPKLRILLFRLHAFLGLHVCLVLGLIFLSGSILMFVVEIEASYTKTMRLSEPATSHDATFGQVYDNIKAFDTDLQPLYFAPPHSLWMGQKTVARAAGGHQVSVWSHPQTAEILGVTGENSLHDTINDFHVDLMTGNRIGTILNSAFSMVLMFFIISGLITYRRFWKGFFRWPTRLLNARAWWGGIHRLTALWVFPFLIVVSITGFYYFIGALQLISVTRPVVQQSSERSQTLPEGFSGAELDRAVEVALDSLPNLDLEFVEMPFGPHEGITVSGQTDVPFVSKGGNRVVVDPVTYKILGQSQAQDISASLRLEQIITSVHTGIWGGFYSRVLWLGFGVLATSLTISGAMVYTSRVVNGPSMKGKTAVGRYWHGMTWLKWGLVAYLSGVIFLTVYRLWF